MKNAGCRCVTMVLGLGFSLLVAFPACAYIDMGPTLGRVLREADSIALVEVTRFSASNGLVALKLVRSHKGKADADTFKHQVLRSDETSVDHPILEWADSGRRAVLFMSPKTVLVCIGRGWYQVHLSDDGWWRIGAPRPDLPLAFYGTVTRLSEALESILANKSAVITTMPHGAQGVGASFNLAFNRSNLPGLVEVQRIRADSSMPAMAGAVLANPAYLVGPGPAGEEDLPALRQKLRSPDATVRAETVGDLGSLGLKAAPALQEVVELLTDPSAMVRTEAAAAVLRIRERDSRALRVLSESLSSENVVVRRHGARAVGFAGQAGAPLAEPLGKLLRDPDVLVRRAALEAIATLGPAAAATASHLVPLLEDPQTTVDAADALGRIGPSAQDALGSLAKLLASPSRNVRWAAVRAMAQIGGDEASPAVRFMTSELRTASEMDTYNILIYLAMLGPVAKEALPAIQNARIRNPFLKQATSWIIDPDRDLPGGAMGGADFAQWVLEASLSELGERLKPAALTLARRVEQGRTRDLPPWAYKLLSRFPEQSLEVLAPGLEGRDVTTRERSVVALGYMGVAARPARERIKRAAARAEDERERLLFAWCLREVE